MQHAFFPFIVIFTIVRHNLCTYHEYKEALEKVRRMVKCILEFVYILFFCIVLKCEII